MLLAYVNHGRWLADCPRCNTGWKVDTATPQVLYCAHCNPHEPPRRQLMGETVMDHPHRACFCGEEAMVQFPSTKESIDIALDVRPDATTRNWRPGETSADLRIENAVHGIATPTIAESRGS